MEKEQLFPGLGKWWNGIITPFPVFGCNNGIQPRIGWNVNKILKYNLFKIQYNHNEKL